MKFSVSKIFDNVQVASTKSYTELQSFFDFFSTFSQQVGDILQRRVSVTDNLDCELIVIDKVTSQGVLQRFRGRPVAIFVAQSNEFVPGFFWKPANGQVAQLFSQGEFSKVTVIALF